MRVRVFLPTYRRPQHLPDALASLRAQTMTDWICELHNDDPADAFPAKLVAQLADPRIVLHQHSRNLGGTATFNLFFRGCTEPYFSILEDDNVWDPDFLETMIRVAEAHPSATVFWANMRVREEQADGGWRQTGSSIRPYHGDPTPILFDWGQPEQLFGALHSNGAMLVRQRFGPSFVIPDVPFAAIEMFRERLFPYPLVHVPRPLADFSLTRQTARSRNRSEWAELQVMLAASFLGAAPYATAQNHELWSKCRAQRPPMHLALLWAALLHPRCRIFLKFARPADWARLAAGALRHPSVPLRLLRSRRLHPEWWCFLEETASAQFKALIAGKH
jgi:hypothetical protein